MRLMRLTATTPIGRPGQWGPRFLDSAYARRLEGALSVRQQLAWIGHCNNGLARLDISELLESGARGMTAAVAISYRQCFNDGSRKYRLKEKHVVKCTSHSLDLHRQVMAVANKAIAHADSWLDGVAVGMSVNQRGEFSGLHTQHLQAAVLRKEEHERLVPAIAELEKVVAGEIEELTAKCTAHAEKLSPQERLDAAELSLVPPEGPVDGIKP